MKKRNLHWIVLVLVVSLSALLPIACSSGGGSSSSSGTTLTTLEGVDSNGDGVRDDIESYIALTYSDEPTRKALTQYAKAYQSKLLNANDKAATLDNASSIDKAIDCAFSARGAEAVLILGKINSEFLNTEERVRANIAADKLLSGETFPASSIQDRADNCE